MKRGVTVSELPFKAAGRCDEHPCKVGAGREGQADEVSTVMITVQDTERDLAEVDRLLDDLDASYAWRDDAAELVQSVLAVLPAPPAAEAQRARATLLGLDQVISEQGAAAAAPIALGVRDRAEAHGDRALQAHAERALSLLFRKIGDPAAALEHAVASLTLDDGRLTAVHRCKLHMVTADSLALSGSAEDAREHYRQALEHARGWGSVHLTAQVLNNWAYTDLLFGELTSAAALVAQVQDLCRENALTPILSLVSTIAEVSHALGRSQEAADLLRHRLAADPSVDPVNRAGCWLTLAQIQRDMGALDGAEASLDATEEITSTGALRALRVEVMGARAELLAARGDHASAYEMHRRFMAETLELRSEASDARARTLHAMFEVDEARRESARYREMSYRDPLTGLFNRRHVDEDLDRRLGRAAPVAIAMVDLDHFKHVNDRCSHEAGDAVLVRLAALLETSAAGTRGGEGAYAARLGGEEFLLVLPGADLSGAYEIAEGVRRQMAALDWSDLCEGVPVTASIGVATTGGSSPVRYGRADLLREADGHLYAAKRNGRNRVEPHAGRARMS